MQISKLIEILQEAINKNGDAIIFPSSRDNELTVEDSYFTQEVKYFTNVHSGWYEIILNDIGEV